MFIEFEEEKILQEIAQSLEISQPSHRENLNIITTTSSLNNKEDFSNPFLVENSQQITNDNHATSSQSTEFISPLPETSKEKKQGSKQTKLESLHSCIHCRIEKVTCVFGSCIYKCQRCIEKGLSCHFRTESFIQYIRHLRRNNAQLIYEIKNLENDISLLNYNPSQPNLATSSGSSLKNSVSTTSLLTPSQNDNILSNITLGTLMHLPNEEVFPTSIPFFNTTSSTLPASLWVSSDGVTRPILVECNETFVNFFGYPLNTLRTQTFNLEDYLVPINLNWGNLFTANGPKLVQVIQSLVNTHYIFVLAFNSKSQTHK